MAITKIDETTFERTSPQPDRVEKLTLDDLIRDKKDTITRKENYILQVDAEIAKLDADISEAREAGIKSKAEVEVQKQEDIIN